MSMDAEHEFNRVTEDMSKVSAEISATARNAQSMILQRLALVNNGEIAGMLGVDASTFSRFISEIKSSGLTNTEMFCELLDRLGLKVVNANDVYCSPEVAEATRVFLSNSFSSPDYMRILFK